LDGRQDFKGGIFPSTWPCFFVGISRLLAATHYAVNVDSFTLAINSLDVVID
jgi:hypothetical protein